MYDKATNQAIFYVSIMNSFSSYIMLLLGIKHIEPKVIGFTSCESAVNETLSILSRYFHVIDKKLFHFSYY